VKIIDARIGEMAARYGPAYPSAMKCLTTDKEGLTAYLRFPAGHHNRIRHSNFIERTFGETAAAPRSSAGSPARPAASPSSGPSWTAPPAAGAAWP
jgi:transposase-like protein